jgi:hypothetical protein
MNNQYSTYASFKDFLKTIYTHDDFLNIRHSGCEAGVSGLIYYSETCAVYEAFTEELHDILFDYMEETGAYPDYIINQLGYADGFKNAVVWFAAEYLVNNFLNELENNEA